MGLTRFSENIEIDLMIEMLKKMLDLLHDKINHTHPTRLMTKVLENQVP